MKKAISFYITIILTIFIVSSCAKEKYLEGRIYERFNNIGEVEAIITFDGNLMRMETPPNSTSGKIMQGGGSGYSYSKKDGFCQSLHGQPKFFFQIHGEDLYLTVDIMNGHYSWLSGRYTRKKDEEKANGT